jgi:hypothetical protein
MGNYSCRERPRVTAWDGDDDHWGLPPAKRSGEAPRTAMVGSTRTKVKIRMTKGQLRRLLESAGHGGSTADEAVIAEVMSMGAVRVEVVDAARHGQATEMHHKASSPKLETIQEDDFAE